MANPNPQNPMTWLVAITPALRDHPLWPGSMIELTFRYSGLSRQALLDAYNVKRACDDLTANEETFLIAMRDTLDANGVEHG